LTGAGRSSGGSAFTGRFRLDCFISEHPSDDLSSEPRHRPSLRCSMAYFFAGDVRWAAVASLATRKMTLFINLTGHRDSQAVHAKFDELLRAHGEARTELTALTRATWRISRHQGRSAASRLGEIRISGWRSLENFKSPGNSGIN
jgi:hypothetical protein